MLSVAHYFIGRRPSNFRGRDSTIGNALLRIKATRNISGYHLVQSDLAFVSATIFTRGLTVKVRQYRTWVDITLGKSNLVHPTDKLGFGHDWLISQTGLVIQSIVPASPAITHPEEANSQRGSKTCLERCTECGLLLDKKSPHRLIR